MQQQAQTRRPRAQRPDVLVARAGRSAVAPLSTKLLEWHRATALLTARVQRAQLRGGCPDLLPDIEALAQKVAEEIEAWRSGLEVDDRTGRVDDAVRASSMILDSLARLRADASSAER